MTKREQYENRTEELILPILKEHGYALYDVEYVKEGNDFYLRAYIDKPGGITIEDCEVVSRPLSDLLDQYDFISDAYILEISSPGLGRQLKKDKHFEKSIGSGVEVKLYRAVERKKEYSGILEGYDSRTVWIMDEGKRQEFERENIAVIRLAVDF